MKKQVFICLAFAIIAIFALNAVSAEIIVSQPSSLYNVGDDFSASVSLKPQVNTNDFLVASIVCDSGQVEIYKSPYNVQANQGKDVIIEAKLDKSLIENLTGLCHLNVDFGSEYANSQNFEISGRINVNLIVANSILLPGDKFAVSGSAVKTNSQPLDGFVQISIPGTNSTVVSDVSNGTFSAEVIIPNDAPGGSYNVEVNVYEKDSLGNLANQGSASTPVKIKQVSKSIDVAIDNPTLTPPANISLSALLKDQSGADVKQDVSVIVYDSHGDAFFKKVVNEGDSNVIGLPSNAAPGYWSIEATYGNLNIKRQFFVEEVENATFNLDNQTLVVTNTGNVPYNKELEIKIGEQNEIYSVNLGVGESKRLKLHAPEGQYSISVNGGASNYNLGSSFLTGNAVGVSDLNSLSSDPKAVMWFWIVLILVLIVIGYAYYRKVRNKSYTAKSPGFGNFGFSKPSFSSHKQSTNKPVKATVGISSFAENMIEKPSREGKIETYNPEPAHASTHAKAVSNYISESNGKEPVTVIAIKIKNSQKLRDSQSSAFLTIEHALEQARRLRAKVYDQGTFKIIVFAPKLTKKTELDNYLESVRVASQINETFKEFNKKYAIKIDYGIGGHVGEMFFEMADGKPKFTSAGNTTIVAKNAAEKANNEILVSNLLHRKVYNVVKGEQMQNGLYKVNALLERAQHSEFIQRFMKKNK